MKCSLLKYYLVITESRIICSAIFSLLYISGLVRYRFGLMFVSDGLLTAFKQYLLLSDPKRRLNWKPISYCLNSLWLLAIYFDWENGQLYPKYPNLPAWVSIAVSAIGILAFIVVLRKIYHIFQNISREAIFVICPNCSFDSHFLTERCKNCGYSYGKPIEDVEISVDPPDEIKREMKEYRKQRILKKVNKEVIRGIKLSKNEHILIAIKTPGFLRFVGIKKNGTRIAPCRFIATENRIICYYGLKGWRSIDFIQYPEIRNLKLAKDAFGNADFLILDTLTDTFEFLFGHTPIRIIRRLLYFDFNDNYPISEILFKFIKKRSKK